MFEKVSPSHPDKIADRISGAAINAVALAAVVVLFALVIFQGVTLVEMKQYNDDSQRFTEYWRHKTDSLSDENFKLYMQIYELKDSIITLRFDQRPARGIR